MPNKHMEYLVDKLRNIHKKEDQILVVSQNTLTRDIASCILQNINSLEKYKILYKLHPAEQKNWQSYSELKRLSSYKNVKITDNSESIYKLMAESKFCIGVYSTALIESIYFGCKVFLLDLPGVEMMEGIIKAKRAVIVNDNLKESLKCF
jgi:spore coat polysaccharide biosynthesis predicted glycosyltransferase SpsG